MFILLFSSSLIFFLYQTFLFLYFCLEVLAEAKEQLVFKDKILLMATNIIQLMAASTKKEVVVVGVHVRRGDKLRVWKQSKFMQGRVSEHFLNWKINSNTRIQYKTTHQEARHPVWEEVTPIFTATL